MLKEGGYEADSSQIYYGMPGKWSPAIEDLIVTKVKQLAGVDWRAPETARAAHAEGGTRDVPDRSPASRSNSSRASRTSSIRSRCASTRRAGCSSARCAATRTAASAPATRPAAGSSASPTRTATASSRRASRSPRGCASRWGSRRTRTACSSPSRRTSSTSQDTDGDGKADKTTVLYTGFNLANIQQMVNSLQWGLDNWVYGCAGSDGGTVTSAEKPDAPPVSLRNRGFRFQPDVPGSLEPTSGGGQYGLTADDYQRWFTATNSQHLRQIVLPDHYLRRNPYLPVSAVTLDIPDHGAAAQVFRISPFEPWRVERTTRRAGGPDATRFPPTELVPGGFITSACSPLIYTADLFPQEYRGNIFVCDPANNLIHRDLLEANGAAFTAVRADPDCEFLASTDNWFRPVHLSIGPDGAIYVLDFYREVIETPLSLPDDIKKQLNLESRGRGRIWRIAPNGLQGREAAGLRRS